MTVLKYILQWTIKTRLKSANEISLKTPSISRNNLYLFIYLFIYEFVWNIAMQTYREVRFSSPAMNNKIVYFGKIRGSFVPLFSVNRYFKQILTACRWGSVDIFDIHEEAGRPLFILENTNQSCHLHERTYSGYVIWTCMRCTIYEFVFSRSKLCKYNWKHAACFHCET